MNPRDAWFLGLFTLAYLYLDSLRGVKRPVPESLAANRGRALHVKVPPAPRFFPARVAPPAACPRNRLHSIALRADGAMWCRSCDEGFYPSVDVWDPVLEGVAA